MNVSRMAIEKAAFRLAALIEVKDIILGSNLEADVQAKVNYLLEEQLKLHLEYLKEHW